MSAIEGVVAYQGWSLRGVPLYNILTHNCQHFASKLAEYLKTAQCSGSRKRNTEELTAFADNLVFNCTECCEVADTEGTAVQVMAPTVLLLLALIPLLDQ